MSLNPLVSVIIPCFNHGLYIDECLNSVYRQSYNNIEVIIINDGSTDKFTVDKLESINDCSIKIINSENRGLSNARNLGINKSNGKYILPLDADDYISVEYISKAVSILEEDEKIILVYGKAEYFGEKIGLWDLKPFSFQEMLLYNQIYASAIFRKSDYLDTGGYDTNLNKGWEDWDFWLSMLTLHSNVYFINEVCFYYRVKSDSMIVRMSKEDMINARAYIYRKHYQLYNLLFSDPIQLYHEKCYYQNKYNLYFTRRVVNYIKNIFLK
jgi:glycosyltransferase involved in cell wall biosynthesis